MKKRPRVAGAISTSQLAPGLACGQNLVGYARPPGYLAFVPTRGAAGITGKRFGILWSFAKMPHPSPIDRVRGCMLGMAVGDALGAPLEGLTSQQITTHYGRIKNYVDGVQAWKRKPTAGERGDCIRTTRSRRWPSATSCSTRASSTPIDWPRSTWRLPTLRVRLSEPIGGSAGASAWCSPNWNAGSRRAGAARKQRALGPPCASRRFLCTTVMIATRFLNRSCPSSIMTHRDIRSITGALAVAHAIRRLMAGSPRDAGLLLWVAADVAGDEARIAKEYGDVVISSDRHARALPRALAHVESVMDLQPRERVLAALVEEANRHGAEPVCRLATMGFPPACIPTCFYHLLTTDSFEECLTEIVNQGGDTDTTGAILGAMAGACYGVDEIPRRWLDGLQNREGIEARARALANRSTAGLKIPDLVATEHELSRKEVESLQRVATLVRGGGDRGANRVI